MGQYNGSLTREQFLFFEMRITAKLMTEGLSDDEVVVRIIEENLFQYPTERSVKKMARVCIERLNAMTEQSLVQAIASQSSEIAKQICLYAIMKYSKLVYEFMVTVIGDKYSSKDYSFGRIDLNVFFMRLQEQDDDVASWSDATIQKIKQVITRMLVETEYIDNTKSDHLNPVWLNPILENVLQERGETEVLKAFNYFL
ncbi:MAG: DUF1819 family protein [Lachnospiraceae bacterium]|nr:DUF1819 family protein [Lachnospiraceae bacterium]